MDELNLADDASRTSTIGSLIPADSSVRSDDGSYVCVRNAIASPPSSLNTLNTLTETMSVGDLVVVGADGGDITDLDVPQNVR